MRIRGVFGGIHGEVVIDVSHQMVTPATEQLNRRGAEDVSYCSPEPAFGRGTPELLLRLEVPSLLRFR